eukprot:TRINITY_DN44905_c0_g1_i1.p1 TRINITY_DN44905_c0_g1~~TRINITY_DN44905_c0_g1_i1.p1  ORF type:complete len:112 (+),score=16.70 TRINITY_DN44905_c0_g1_i1:80-415(+)
MPAVQPARVVSEVMHSQPPPAPRLAPQTAANSPEVPEMDELPPLVLNCEDLADHNEFVPPQFGCGGFSSRILAELAADNFDKTSPKTRCLSTLSTSAGSDYVGSGSTLASD